MDEVIMRKIDVGGLVKRYLARG
ncbi:hypothetical protein CCACVL1_27604 [Corchorus capsularis]|uniref:Uncharacterized protein n=1 Tax=Corchorus capsularis TaxID=210143 RepID=A0A1R3G9J1_COCAP|nr:hypothetical protein CCACVL1_27604 [Corchorus capsularis]